MNKHTSRNALATARTCEESPLPSTDGRIGIAFDVRKFDLQHWRRRLVGYFTHDWKAVRSTSAPALGTVPQGNLHRVLICRPNHRLGNLLLLTPLITELQTNYPGTQVDLIVGGSGGENLFRSFHNIGEIYSLPRHALRHPWKFLSTIRKLRQQRYDLAIDPDISSQSSRLLTLHCLANYRIGFCGRKASAKLTCAMPVPSSTRHMGQLPVLLLRWAIARTEATQGSQSLPALDIQLTPAERARGRRELDAIRRATYENTDSIIISLYTYATEGKRYQGEWWLRMLNALRAKYPSAQFLEILPAHGQSALDGLIPGYYSSKPRRVAAIIAATKMILVADSGIMHLACACRGPVVVGLFICTDPNVYGPYGFGNQAISTAGLEPVEICRKLSAVC